MSASPRVEFIATLEIRSNLNEPFLHAANFGSKPLAHASNVQLRHSSTLNQSKGDTNSQSQGTQAQSMKANSWSNFTRDRAIASEKPMKVLATPTAKSRSISCYSSKTSILPRTAQALPSTSARRTSTCFAPLALMVTSNFFGRMLNPSV